MKLCFSTLGCPDWSFEQVLAHASAMGYQAIEVRGIKDEMQLDKIPAFMPENRTRTQALLDEAGIEIEMLNASMSLHSEDAYERGLDEVKSALAIANDMGIPAVRVFGDARPADDKAPYDPHIAAQNLEKLCDIAQQMGKAQIRMEVHGAANTIEALSPILEKVGDHPNFGLVWDIQHSFRAMGNDIDDFYDLVRPYVKHMHIKDCRKTPDGLKLLPVGEGDIDIMAIVRKMEQSGYHGYYSFEWEKRWVKDLAEPEIAFPAYVEYMQQ